MGRFLYQVEKGALAYDAGAYIQNTGPSWTTLEGVEDGDIAEYSGETGYFEAETSPVADGAYSIHSQVSQTRGMQAITRTDLTTQQGEIYDAQVVPPRRSGPVIGVQSATGFASLSGYTTELNANGSDFQLVRYDSGAYNQLAATTVSLSSSSYHRVKIEWTTSGDLTATLYDTDGTKMATLSATDTTYVSGGLGWVGNGKDDQYYDTFRRQQ